MRTLLSRIAILSLLTSALACGPTTSNPSDGDGGAGGGDGGGGCNGASCDNKCPGGTMTTISGTVTAPNGIDPVPGAIVYVPREITEFPSEVRCEVCDQLTDISIVSTTTDVDGTFTLGPIPTAENPIPGGTVQLVAQKGRFRKLADVTVNNWCAPNATGDATFRLPSRNDGFNNIPKIAVATGDYDVMECVLLNIGLEPGSFDLYNAMSFGSTPQAIGNFDSLLNDINKMRQYNIIFVNCTGDTYEDMLANEQIRNNIRDYVQTGGRLYVTDWSYDYIEQIGEFSPIIDFGPGASGPTPEPANEAAIGDGDITTEALVGDDGLRRWLEAVEAKTGESIIDANGRVHIEHFLVSWVMQFMVATTDNVKVWLTGQVSGGGLSGELPLTTTFDYEACGRVLYSSYHTAGRDFFAPDSFPTYCSTGPLSPQERVLEYLIFHVADCITVE